MHNGPNHTEKEIKTVASLIKVIPTRFARFIRFVHLVYSVLSTVVREGAQTATQLAILVVMIANQKHCRKISGAQWNFNKLSAANDWSGYLPFGQFTLLFVSALAVHGKEDQGSRTRRIVFRAFFRPKQHISCGAYSDVVVGNLYLDLTGVKENNHFPKKVAVKTLRVSRYMQGGRTEQYLRDLRREARIWSTCHHRNIVPLLGVIIGMSDTKVATCSFVSKFCAKGTIVQYLREKPVANRMKPLLEIAGGLSYLHTRDNPIIHRDIKGSNILIDDDGVAMIGDFGCAMKTCVESKRCLDSMDEPGEISGSVRWLSPEIIMPSFYKNEKDTIDEETSEWYTTASDVWAFGMTALEVLTSELPFANICNDGAVLLKIINKGMPDMPHPPMKRLVLHCIWTLMKKCWAWDPKERPSMECVKEELKKGCINDDQHIREFPCCRLPAEQD